MTQIDKKIELEARIAKKICIFLRQTLLQNYTRKCLLHEGVT